MERSQSRLLHNFWDQAELVLINVLDFQAELGGHSHSIISQHYPFSFSPALSEPPTGTQQIENSMQHRAYTAQFYSLLEPPSFPFGPLF